MMIDTAETLNKSRVAVMQPYFLPYLGYFQLIRAADVFVFYDDVQFIKKGWLRRNRIWSNNQEQLISLPCIEASQNKLIKDVQVDVTHSSYRKIKGSIYHAYRKAPEFENLAPLIDKIFEDRPCSVSVFNVRSICLILNYIGISAHCVLSSEISPESRGMHRADRLISITKKLGSSTYINSPGGRDLYDKTFFKSQDVDLQFLNPKIPTFGDGRRLGQKMNLSIIDSLMWQSAGAALDHLNSFHVEPS